MSIKKVCVDCTQPLRYDKKAKAWFHVVPGYPELGTIARNTRKI